MPPPDEQEPLNQHDSKEVYTPNINQNAKNIYNINNASDNKFGDYEVNSDSLITHNNNNSLSQSFKINLSELSKDLENINKQAKLLINYAQIGNLFLKLKSQCQEVIIQQSRQNTIDEESLDLLEICYLQTDQIIEEFIRLSDKFKSQNIKCDFLWIEDIKKITSIIKNIYQKDNPSNKKVYQEYSKFIEREVDINTEKQSLEFACLLIEQILCEYPHQFAQKFDTVASHLNLSESIVSLRKIFDKKILYFINLEKCDQIQDKINLFANLNEKFMKLIDAHLLWQKISTVLDKLIISDNNCINVAINRRRLNELFKLQSINIEKNWQQSFEKKYINLDNALSNKDSVKINHYFPVFQNTVKRHLSRNNTELQQLCIELQQTIELLLYTLNLIK